MFRTTLIEIPQSITLLLSIEFLCYTSHLFFLASSLVSRFPQSSWLPFSVPELPFFLYLQVFDIGHEEHDIILQKVKESKVRPAMLCLSHLSHSRRVL